MVVVDETTWSREIQPRFSQPFPGDPGRSRWPWEALFWKSRLGYFSEEKQRGAHPWKGAGLPRWPGPQDSPGVPVRMEAWQSHWETERCEKMNFPRVKRRGRKLQPLRDTTVHSTDWWKIKKRKGLRCGRRWAKRKSGNQLIVVLFREWFDGSYSFLRCMHRMAHLRS